MIKDAGGDESCTHVETQNEYELDKYRWEHGKLFEFYEDQDAYVLVSCDPWARTKNQAIKSYEESLG